MYIRDLGMADERETHISRVWLTATTAYKVKKPVRFAFVECSSLDKRLAACLAEVELNRRWAPDVYRGVAALVAHPGGGLAVRPQDDPHAVDYAVVMDRYDESATLASRLARGLAMPSDLAA